MGEGNIELLLASLKSCRQREKLKVMVDAMAAEVMLKLPQSTVLPNIWHIPYMSEPITPP